MVFALAASLPCMQTTYFAVVRLALSGALRLTPAEFNRRWWEGGPSALQCIAVSDPAGRQQAAAVALGELLQAADGLPGPLQQQYQQQGEVLVQMAACIVDRRASCTACQLGQPAAGGPEQQPDCGSGAGATDCACLQLGR